MKCDSFYQILKLWSVLLPCREEILTVATDAEAAEISGTELLLKEEEAAIGKTAFILPCCPVCDA